jgi:hypothetical protein
MKNEEEMMSFAGEWMKLEIIMLSEISQTQTNVTFSLIHGIHSQKYTHTQKRHEHKRGTIWVGTR